MSKIRPYILEGIARVTTSQTFTLLTFFTLVESSVALKSHRVKTPQLSTNRHLCLCYWM